MVMLTWVSIFAWILVATLWPLPRKEKMWGNLIFALILGVWKIVHQNFWKWHWAFISVSLVTFFSLSYLYTAERLQSIRTESPITTKKRFMGRSLLMRDRTLQSKEKGDDDHNRPRLNHFRLLLILMVVLCYFAIVVAHSWERILYWFINLGAVVQNN